LFCFFIMRNLPRFQHLMYSLGFLYGVRVISIALTGLPNSRRCDEPASCHQSYFTNIRDAFCGDMMYSGHTLTASIFIYYVSDHLSRLWMKMICYAALILFLLGLAFSRLHYSVDVWLAGVLSFLVREYFASLEKNARIHGQPPVYPFFIYTFVADFRTAYDYAAGSAASETDSIMPIKTGSGASATKLELFKKLYLYEEQLDGNLDPFWVW